MAIEKIMVAHGDMETRGGLKGLGVYEFGDISNLSFDTDGNHKIMSLTDGTGALFELKQGTGYHQQVLKKAEQFCLNILLQHIFQNFLMHT